MPRTPAELIKISGVGKTKLESYGEEVIELLHGTAVA